MPEYKYSALSTKDAEVKGTVEATDKMGAIGAIRELGLFPTKVRDLCGREPTNEPAINEEEVVQRYIDALPKSYNPITLLKNFIRRRILLGSLKKDKNSR